jgi:hypothetical protein
MLTVIVVMVPVVVVMVPATAACIVAMPPAGTRGRPHASDQGTGGDDFHAGVANHFAISRNAQ